MLKALNERLDQIKSDEKMTTSLNDFCQKLFGMKFNEVVVQDFTGKKIEYKGVTTTVKNFMDVYKSVGLQEERICYFVDRNDYIKHLSSGSELEKITPEKAAEIFDRSFLINGKDIECNDFKFMKNGKQEDLRITRKSHLNSSIENVMDIRKESGDTLSESIQESQIYSTKHLKDGDPDLKLLGTTLYDMRYPLVYENRPLMGMPGFKLEHHSQEEVQNLEKKYDIKLFDWSAFGEACKFVGNTINHIENSTQSAKKVINSFFD